MAFLGLKSGLLVGVAIPGSFLTGILVLATMGVTINALALIGLAAAPSGDGLAQAPPRRRQPL